MTDDHQGDVAIARIEATLAGIKNQIDYSERSSAQLVKLVDERFSARFDSLERRLDTMDASRETARVEQARAFDDMEKRIELAAKNAADRADAVAEKLDRRAEAIELRLSAVEKFKFTLLGVAAASAVLTGITVGAVVKALGA
jgi:hypothetical protein